MTTLRPWLAAASMLVGAIACGSSTTPRADIQDAGSRISDAANEPLGGRGSGGSPGSGGQSSGPGGQSGSGGLATKSGGTSGKGGASGGSGGQSGATGGSTATGDTRDAGQDLPPAADGAADTVRPRDDAADVAPSRDDGADSARPDSSVPATFRNPLNTSHGSDPFMAYYQGNYYLAATTWGTTLTMKKGTTISALKAAATTVIWQDSTPSRKGNMWAPEFYLLDDGKGGQRWYHYYTAGDGNDLDTQRSYVLESDGLDPIGPYHFKAQLINDWAIDGSILQAGDKLYFMFSAWQGATQNIWIIAMTNPWTVTGQRTLLSQPTYAWEKEGSDSVNEGPVALYHEGRTFVTYSASQCASPGYKLGMLELVGGDPLKASSWEKSATPVFKTANQAYGSGHNGFFKSPDGSEDWIVYHATSNAQGSCWTDRTTRIQKIAWQADGSPDFGVPLALTTDIPVPAGE